MSEYEIVAMDYSDIDEVVRIEKACFSMPWSKESFLSSMDSGNTAFFIAAAADGKAVGYAGIQHILDEGYVTNIAALPLYRRLGIGRLLLEKLINFAIEKKLSTLSLEVRPTNINAIALYESVGFVQIGFRKNFYQKPTEDCIIMTLTTV